MLKFTQQIRCWKGEKPCLSHLPEQIRSIPRRRPTAQGLFLFPSTLHFKWGMCVIACPSSVDQARPGWQRGHVVHAHSHTSAELGVSAELFRTENRSHAKNNLVGRFALRSRHLSTVFFLYVLQRHRLETSWLGGLHPLPLAGALVIDPWVTLSNYLSESQFPHQ